MSDKKATLLESVLGVKKAETCLQEIEQRIHPEDTPEFRKELITQVLRRHISKKDLKLSEVDSFIDESERSYTRRMVNNIVYKVYDNLVASKTIKKPLDKGR